MIKKLTSFNKILTTLLFLSLFIYSVSSRNLRFVNTSYRSCAIIPQYTCVTPGVVYASLSASIVKKSIIVNWITASEENNSHFEVERSLDMKIFKTIGLVLDGFTADGTGKAYMFKENSSVKNDNKPVYYRLKQISNDGIVTYSSIMTVGLEEKVPNAIMQVTPNPFSNKLTISFNSFETGLAEIRILNLAGQTMLSKQSTIIKGNINLQLEGFSSLAPGIYIARLSLNGKLIDNQKINKK